MDFVVRAQHVFLPGRLHELARLASLEPDPAIHVLKSRLYYCHFYAHGVGASGTDLRNIATTTLFARLYRLDEHRSRLHFHAKNGCFRAGTTNSGTTSLAVSSVQ